MTVPAEYVESISRWDTWLVERDNALESAEAVEALAEELRRSALEALELIQSTEHVGRRQQAISMFRSHVGQALGSGVLGPVVPVNPARDQLSPVGPQLAVLGVDDAGVAAADRAESVAWAVRDAATKTLEHLNAARTARRDPRLEATHVSLPSFIVGQLGPTVLGAPATVNRPPRSVPSLVRDLRSLFATTEEDRAQAKVAKKRQRALARAERTIT